jgi:preprotein translocase subunit SecD
LRIIRKRKAGLSGLFRRTTLAAAFLVIWTAAAAAEPLAVEVVDVGVGFDQRTSEPIITFKMSEATRRLFAKLTEDNVGRKLEMRIDGKTVSAPVIREPILGGSGQISGGFSEPQARDIAARLSSGISRLEMEIVD